MSLKIATPITIRVQARDGMFLGPDSYQGAKILIKDAHNNTVLASGSTNSGDSGSRSDNYIDDASLFPIITPAAPQPVIHWVVASDSTVNYTTTLTLSKATLLKIEVTIPLPAEQSDQLVTVTQWVEPGQALTNGAGFVIDVPGLWVQPQATAQGHSIDVTAKVTMMCGCKIEDGTPWVPADFDVVARILHAGDEKPIAETPLSFQSESIYTGQLQAPGSGAYTLLVYALQHSTTNQGVARLPLTIEG
ncbi:MAG: hypothetical protein Tsb002_33860 [Wenzhouxiangellaceae bacterium]